MPDLIHSLAGQDQGHLLIVAELWGVELKSKEPQASAKELANSLLDPDLVGEMLASLPASAREAVNTLVRSSGRIPWATFTRQFGTIREMGAGKRDREQPQRKPGSTSEVLFYRALLAHAFFDTDKGPQEYAYVPDDLLRVLNARRSAAGASLAAAAPLGRGATPGEKGNVRPADDRILDDATTLLAALRLGRKVQADPLLHSLLTTAKLLKKDGPQAEKVKAFLEAPRAEALNQLYDAWRGSQSFNELRLLPGLIFEGEWKNQPLAAREFLLGLLQVVPEGKWWNLQSFISDIKKKYPDYQRPAGDYDSWFIKRAADGQYLRGFAYWDQVDGAMIHYLIVEILHKLGRIDLAAPDEGSAPTAFHFSSLAPKKEQIGKIKVASNGSMIASRLVPRAVRYQLARFCEWDEPSGPNRPDEYRYHISPQSLTRATAQGLKVEHLLALLAKHTDAGVPPILIKALKRWEANGTEVRAEPQVVLRVSRPEILEELRRSKAARFLGESLGPASVIIKAGAQSKVMAALAEMGLLAEDVTQIEQAG